MHPQIRRIATAAGVVGALGFTVPVEAGIGVVTVNQHGPNEVNDHGDCTYCPDGSSFCPQECPNDGAPDCRYDHPADFNNGAETLPYPATSSEWPDIDVFSHHVNPWRPSSGSSDWRRWRGRFCQAIAEYSPSGRPKILSTDMAGVEVKHDGDGTDVAFYLGLVCSDAAISGRKGRLHFEHYDRYLNEHSEAGNCIDGWSSVVTRSRNALNAIAGFSNCGSDHHPNGLLFRGTSTNPNNRHKLFVTQPRSGAGAPATVLKGYGYMGALAAGERLDAESYFRILGWKGVNLTRVWAVEQWNAQAVPDQACVVEQEQGPTPLAGVWQRSPPHGPGGDYHLDQPNQDFYERLRRFVQEAADRGIVVQLSLYDIHGLLDYNHVDNECAGRFDYSPYNSAHNNSGYIIWNHPGNCGPCSGGFGGEATEGRSGDCKGPNGFVTNGSLQANHLAYVRRVADEVGGMGNVMFEIINEAMAGLDWWTTNPRGDAWQLQQAEILSVALPVSVVRDAFNDDWTSGASRSFTLGSTRVPDSKVPGTINWTASNVRIVQTRDLVVDGGTTISTDNWLGHATPNGNAGSMSMWGRLPFPEPTVGWTDLNVRAELTGATGAVGFDISRSAGGGIGVTFRPGIGTLELWGTGSSCFQVCSFGTVSVPDPTTESHEVRLKLTKQSATDYLATVFLDGDTTTLADVPIAIDPGAWPFAEVGFSGSIGGTVGTPYPPGTHEVDNFEATYVCRTCAASAGDDPGPVEQDPAEEGEA